MLKGKLKKGLATAAIGALGFVGVAKAQSLPLSFSKTLGDQTFSLSAAPSAGGVPASLQWIFSPFDNQDFKLNFTRGMAGDFSLNGGFSFTGEKAKADVTFTKDEGFDLTGKRVSHSRRDPYTHLGVDASFGNWNVLMGYTSIDERYTDVTHELYGIGAATKLGRNEFTAISRLTDVGGLASIEWERQSDKMSMGAQVTGGTADLTADRFNFEGAENAAQAHGRIFLKRKNLEFTLQGSQKSNYDTRRTARELLTPIARTRLLGQKLSTDKNMGEDVVQDSVGARLRYSGKNWNIGGGFDSGEQFIRGLEDPDTFTEYSIFGGANLESFTGNANFQTRQLQFGDLKFFDTRFLIDGQKRIANRVKLGLGVFGEGTNTEMMNITGTYASLGGALSTEVRIKDNWIGIRAGLEEAGSEIDKRGSLLLTYSGKLGQFGVGASSRIHGMDRSQTEEINPLLFGNVKIGQFQVKGEIDPTGDGTYSLSVMKRFGSKKDRMRPSWLSFTDANGNIVSAPAGLGPDCLGINIHNCGPGCAQMEMPFFFEYGEGLCGGRIATAPQYNFSPNDPQFWEVPDIDPYMDMIPYVLEPERIVVVVDDGINDGPDSRPDPYKLGSKLEDTLLSYPWIINVQYMIETFNFSNVPSTQYVREYLPVAREIVDRINEEYGRDIKLINAPPFGTDDGNQQGNEFIMDGGLGLVDIYATHLYAESQDVYLDRLDQHLAMGRSKPLAILETNYAKNDFSDHNAQGWFIAETLKTAEDRIERVHPGESLPIMLYTLRAQCEEPSGENKQYCVASWPGDPGYRGPTYPNEGVWDIKGPAGEIIRERARLKTNPKPWLGQIPNTVNKVYATQEVIKDSVSQNDKYVPVFSEPEEEADPVQILREKPIRDKQRN
ncbi:hypothetical protein GOV11_04630 [Candidatus Woesearchaeota archaeon]|nr:hypothetical protein [Candidatus Woesearchaeota archaeon]